MKDMHDYHIGNTPLVELPSVNNNRILIKLEGKNFLGSSKSRTGYWILHDLPPEAAGKTIIESTSGNLGFVLGYFCKELGLHFEALVDATMPQPKLDRLKEAGIGYRLVPQEEGIDPRSLRIREANRLTASGNYFWVNQYDNPSGVKAHEITTGPEIWQQTQGAVTHCICAMGSGGTIAGVGRFFKNNAPAVQICGAEPVGSTIYGTQAAPYINAGSGMNGKPGNIARNQDVIDRSFSIPDEESIACAKELYRDHGLNVGITSGLAYAAALRLAQEVSNATIVVLAPDGRETYLQYLE